MILHLDLFTGYGGFSLGLQLAGLHVRTVAYVEWAKNPQEIIKARIKDGWLPDAPIFSDISSFRGEQFRGLGDVLVTAGFPCQPHSVAGLKRGANDERNLWPETLRIIREVGPRYVLLENVPGLLSASSDGGTPAYGGTVVGELASLGYSVHWQTIGADDVGAPHRRKRWWCIAMANTSPTGTRDKPRTPEGRSGTQDVRQGDGTLGSVWPDTTGTDAELADSEIGEPRKSQSGDRGEGTQRRSPELADSDGQRGCSRATDWQDAGDVGQPSETEGCHEPELADSNSKRLEGVESGFSNSQGWQESDGPFGVRSGAIPIWPPGPSDTSGWEQVIRERPDLAPALTKDTLAQFRGVDDGRSHRVDELKALGNGLLPAVAAEFLRRITRKTP